MWLNVKDIVLSEISQNKKTNTLLFQLYELSNVLKFKIENRNIITKNLGEMGKECFNSGDFQFHNIKKFWKPVSQQKEYT